MSCKRDSADLTDACVAASQMDEGGLGTSSGAMQWSVQCLRACGSTCYAVPWGSILNLPTCSALAGIAVGCLPPIKGMCLFSMCLWSCSCASACARLCGRVLVLVLVFLFMCMCSCSCACARVRVCARVLVFAHVLVFFCLCSCLWLCSCACGRVLVHMLVFVVVFSCFCMCSCLWLCSCDCSLSCIAFEACFSVPQPPMAERCLSSRPSISEKQGRWMGSMHLEGRRQERQLRCFAVIRVADPFCLRNKDSLRT